MAMLTSYHKQLKEREREISVVRHKREGEGRKDRTWQFGEAY